MLEVMLRICKKKKSKNMHVHKSLQETQQEGVKENEPLRVRNPAHSGWGIMHTKVKKVKQFSDRVKS